MSEIMEDNLQGRLTKLKSAAEETAIKFYDTMKPAMESVTKAAQKLAEWLGKLSPGTVKVIVVIAGFSSCYRPAPSYRRGH